MVILLLHAWREKCCADYASLWPTFCGYFTVLPHLAHKVIRLLIMPCFVLTALMVPAEQWPLPAWGHLLPNSLHHVWDARKWSTHRIFSTYNIRWNRFLSVQIKIPSLLCFLQLHASQQIVDNNQHLSVLASYSSSHTSRTRSGGCVSATWFHF